MEGIWKALSDPTRRQLLDALRNEPRTTGELCRPFKLSRFAVMKHLSVLERAGLISVRRQGRERWNHLNATPMQHVLSHLRAHVEHRKRGPAMSKAPTTAAKFGVAQLELEIPIKARPARVWQALVKETSAWWNRDFYTSATAKGFVIEPLLGGRAYEDWGNGAGQVWYTVIGVDAPHSIMLQGILTPAFGGPAATILQLVLKGSGRNTVLMVSDTIFGRVGDDNVARTREGWETLFGKGLKAYAEA